MNMANAAAKENCSFDENSDDLDVDEFSNIDSSLPTCLLDEGSQVGDGDDEMWRIMVQSLEPEIMNQDLCSEIYDSDGSSEEYRFPDVDQLESCSTSPDQHLHFKWIDMEMAYSCPSNDMMSYFTDHFTEKMENVVELERLQNYSQVCYGMAMVMEKDDYIGLWQ